MFGLIARVPRWRETLPDGVAYDTLECPLVATDIDPDNTPVYTVPAEHFFMMGATTATIHWTADSSMMWAMCRSRT